VEVGQVAQWGQLAVEMLDNAVVQVFMGPEGGKYSFIDSFVRGYERMVDGGGRFSSPHSHVNIVRKRKADKKLI
jgi:hypothetical protein